jgi:hypothetical protein
VIPRQLKTWTSVDGKFQELVVFRKPAKQKVNNQRLVRETFTC